MSEKEDEYEKLIVGSESAMIQTCNHETSRQKNQSAFSH